MSGGHYPSGHVETVYQVLPVVSDKPHPPVVVSGPALEPRKESPDPVESCLTAFISSKIVLARSKVDFF
jgi:hypothetical protein